MDEKKIARFIREGRGRGEGRHYIPWLTVADVPSRGRSHRPYCPLTGREHQFLSDNEYFAFLKLWWDDAVVDIREQFPILDRRRTLEIATLAGIEHPVDPPSKALWVLTTDFLVTEVDHGNRRLVAYSIKEADDLDDRNVLAKLDIDRLYRQEQQIPFYIWTDRELKTPLTRNLAWIYDSNAFRTEAAAQSTAEARITDAVLAAMRLGADRPVHLVCDELDQRLCIRPGSALGKLRMLLATKRLVADLSVVWLQDQPASTFRQMEGR